MDYQVGSIADLISGLCTPNRPRVQVKAVTPVKIPPVDDDTPRASPLKSAKNRKLLPISKELTSDPFVPSSPVSSVVQKSKKQETKVKQIKEKRSNNFKFLSELSDYESDGNPEGKDEFVKEYFVDKNGIKSGTSKKKNLNVSPDVKNKIPDETFEQNSNANKKNKRNRLEKRKFENSLIDNSNQSENISSDEPQSKNKSKKFKKNEINTDCEMQSEIGVNNESKKEKKKKNKIVLENEMTSDLDEESNTRKAEESVNDGMTDFQKAAQRRIESKMKKELKFDDNELSKTIFVGNIPVSILKGKYKKLLKSIFSPYGAIESIRIRNVPVEDIKTNPKVAFIEKKFHPERSSVSAYIKFADPSSVEKSLAENNTKIEENHIRVDSCSGGSKPKVDGRKTLFLGNLPFNIEEEKIRQYFLQFGEIASVRVIRDKKTQIGKGFGFVNFEKADAVELAVLVPEENMQIDGKTIRVKRYNTYNPKYDMSGNQNLKNNSNSRNQHGPVKSNTNLQFKSKKRDEQGNKLRKRNIFPDQYKKKNSKDKSKDISSSNVAENDTMKNKSHDESYKGLTAKKKKKNKLNKGVLQKKRLSKILTQESKPIKSA